MRYRLFYTDEKTDNRIFAYFLGWQPSTGRLLLVENECTIIRGIVFLDTRYATIAVNSDYLIEKCHYDTTLREQLSGIIPEDAECILEETIPLHIYNKLRNKLGKTIKVEEQSWQSNFRIIKNKKQQDCISIACQHTHAVWTRIKTLARKGELLGKSEITVRAMLVQHALQLGLEREAFDAIVASGANSAIPHHKTSSQPIVAGPLLIDMGYRYQGWCSDMTRTIRIPHADTYKNHMLSKQQKKFDTILAIVKTAYNRATTAIRPYSEAITAAGLDAIARDYITEKGYGDYFGHALGHGIGVDIHESPIISPKNETILRPGMVITIEPGIYLPGQFGVRWENTHIVATD